MKKLILGRIGSDPVVKFAFDELVRYLRAMDETLFLDRRVYAAKEEGKEGILWIGLDGSIPSSIDDKIKIDIKAGAGVITGSNERAVLLAVYRTLFELGCRWIRPGKDGDLIPSKKLEPAGLDILVEEEASYRHRAVCIEGANDYQHVADIIDFLPKVGMNGYFVQFNVPHNFFNRWYEHQSNPTIPGETLSIEDVEHMWTLLEEEIFKRGLMYHAMGHGWTSIPFGIEGGWDSYSEEISPEIKQYFAEVNGKRELWNRPKDTNLCFSNPQVRNIMTDAAVAYCKEHPKLDYLHFWLSDGSNNNCECPGCRDTLPSDFYVMLLNELDEKLTAAGLDTKIVFLLYHELFWEPEVECLHNPDRFVLMFAPGGRTYSKSFVEDNRRLSESEMPPFIRNKMKFRLSIPAILTHLSKWQAKFNGDSFDYDYHLMWDHMRDPGYYECARILHEDMVNLDKIGLNGMVSCQLQRIAYPTCFPMYAMAKGLWDKTSLFEDVAKEYFQAAFGRDADVVRDYMRTLSQLFHPSYLRGELPQEDPLMAEDFAKIVSVVETFSRDYIESNKDKNSTWKYLSYHADMCILLAELLRLRASGEADAAQKKGQELKQFLWDTEMETHAVFDTWIAQTNNGYGRYLV